MLQIHSKMGLGHGHPGKEDNDINLVREIHCTFALNRTENTQLGINMWIVESVSK